MKLLFASDSFKETLTSEQTVECLGRAAREVFGECEYIGLPIADGGEGTTDAVIRAKKGEYIEINVHNPIMEKVLAHYGQIENKKVIMEMAQASGLMLVDYDQRNPLNTTSFGTGEMIKDALDRGFRDISIAIGGSATNDGGMGALRALGVRFLDIDGNELEGYGRDLEKISSIDDSCLHPAVREAQITVMCDVINPLTGAEGATYTFGKQKGGTKEILDRLEKGMENYRKVILHQYGVDPNKTKGTGAAGGLGTGLMVFLQAQMRSGIDTVLDLIGFDEKLTGVDLVVTGEGRTDWQSCFGKVMQGVGNRCRAKGIMAVGLCGSLGEGAEKIYEEGIESIMTTVDAPMSLEQALKNAEDMYYKAAVRMFRMIKVGMSI